MKVGHGVVICQMKYLPFVNYFAKIDIKIKNIRGPRKSQGE